MNHDTMNLDAKNHDTQPPRRRIVVGVDGSACSIDALRWAARQAELTAATVDAVISWEYPTAWGMEFGVIDVDWAANAQQALGAALRQAFGRDPGAACPGADRVSGRVIRGRAADVLLDAAAGAEMLVVGSRGHGTAVGMLLGSVSEQVVAHAPCPVLVMHHRGVVEPESAQQPAVVPGKVPIGA